MRFIFALLGLIVLGGGAFYVLTIPSMLDASSLPSHEPDLSNGELYFHAGGCASCHAAPGQKECDDPTLVRSEELAGGRCLKTPFGTFNVPNISPDEEDGIGGWSDLDFINAMARGVSPDGAHYYPAFPYTSYQRMKLTDLIDLKAYIDQLPKVKSDVPGHDLALPFQLRRGLGLWKFLYLDEKPFEVDTSQSGEVIRGAYLTQGPGHCGECHTPRNLIGGLIRSKAYSGAKAAEGEGFVPNITPHGDGLKDWSKEDIAEALKTGFTPSFDTLGGTMTEVQKNMSKLTDADRLAIGAYLKSVAAFPDSSKGSNSE